MSNNQKNILFKIESNKEIGTGHLMRCLTLANALRDSGNSVYFLLNDTDRSSINLIKKMRFNIIFLKNQKRNNISILEDAFLTKKNIEKNNLESSYLVIDNYKIDKKWEVILRKTVKKIILIDDMANREHDCDVLIDQNYFIKNMANRYSKLVPKKCKLFLGPKFAIIRPEFLVLKKKVKIRNSLKKILISFGGTDPTNETMKILKIIKKSKFNNIKFIIISGRLNAHKTEIKNICKKFKNIVFYSHTKKIADIMLDVDLSFGGGGTTTWERCFVELPTIATILTKNQKAIVESMTKIGCMMNLGSAKKLTKNDYENALDSINSKKLTKMSQACEKFIDGKGVYRLSKIISNL